jgi:hypothetical protein
VRITERTRFAVSSTVLRSERSTIAPAGSDNSSQGSIAAKPTPAIASGALVYERASRGRATLSVPSAMLDREAAPRSRR